MSPAESSADPAAELDQLAEDHHDHKLRNAPTWAHMIGEYRYADRFDEVSRAAEEQAAGEARALAARAEAIDAESLDHQRGVTRAMVAWDASSRAGLLDSRTDEFGANPIFGVQASLGVYLPKLAVPDAEVAEAMVGKFEGVAAYFHDLADRHREGIASGRTPADFAVRQTVEQLDAWLAHPDRRGPDARGAGPARGRRRRPLARAAAGRRAEAGATRRRALPRRAARRGGREGAARRAGAG